MARASSILSSVIRCPTVRIMVLPSDGAARLLPRNVRGTASGAGLVAVRPLAHFASLRVVLENAVVVGVLDVRVKAGTVPHEQPAVNLDAVRRPVYRVENGLFNQVELLGVGQLVVAGQFRRLH